jgi:hypothetical protein
MAHSYILPHYNGFSHEERIATNAVQREAAARGQFRFPTRCSICGFTDPANPRTSGYIFAHLEDYRKPLACHPCCRRCHAALHARFSDPARWHNVLDANWREGEWYTVLSLDPSSQTEPFDQTYPQGILAANIALGR